jgi:hypothetical protein
MITIISNNNNYDTYIRVSSAVIRDAYSWLNADDNNNNNNNNYDNNNDNYDKNKYDMKL